MVRRVQPGRPGLLLADIAADMRDAFGLDHRTDVVEQRPGEPGPLGRGQQHRHQAAERGAEDDDSGELELGDQPLEILKID